MKKLKKLFSAIAIILSIALAVPILNIPGTTITVNAATVKLNKTKKYLNIGSTYQLKLLNNKKTVKWTSNNEDIATVSNNGRVYAKNTGFAIISAKKGSKVYKCEIIVLPVAKKLSLYQNLKVGETIKTEGVIRPPKDKTDIEFIISDPSIISVTETSYNNFEIKALKEGTATLQFKINDSYDTYLTTFTVTEPNPSNTYANLVSYIKKYGSTSTDGNKFIHSNIRDMVVAVIYDETNNMIKYYSLYKTDKATCILTLDVYLSDINTGFATFLYGSNDKIDACKATATVNISQLTNVPILSYTLHEHGYLNDSDYIDLANNFTDLCLYGWNSLYNEHGLSLSDFGFTSYK